MNAPTLVTIDHQHQAANWRALVRLLALAFFVTLIVFGIYVRHTEDSRARADALQACRSKVAADLSSAQVDNDVAFNELVVALTDPARRPYTAEINRITDTGRELKVARDARLAFEAHPTRSC